MFIVLRIARTFLKCGRDLLTETLRLLREFQGGSSVIINVMLLSQRLATRLSGLRKSLVTRKLTSLWHLSTNSQYISKQEKEATESSVFVMKRGRSLRVPQEETVDAEAMCILLARAT